jgi:hypothetical protein
METSERRAEKRASRKSSRTRTKIPSPEKALKPSQCRAFMRRHLAASFPKIVEGFVNQAETGSCVHVKLASELLETRRGEGRGSRKNSAREVLRAWAQTTGKS